MKNNNNNVPTSVWPNESNVPYRQDPNYPYPMQQAPKYVVTTANINNNVVSNGMPMGLPVYTSVDEYGRVYNPIVTYGPQVHSAPVPVAIPSAITQTAPITINLNLMANEQKKY